jgi:hypothetical protein
MTLTSLRFTLWTVIVLALMLAMFAVMAIIDVRTANASHCYLKFDYIRGWYLVCAYTCRVGSPC